MTNFSTDVKDGENYTVLLNQLAPDICSRAPLQTRDLLERAEQVLQNADSLDCRKFLTPTSLVAGNPKLNLAFVANLFNTHPGLDPITEEEKLEVEDFDAEGEREARVFTLWLNSLDVQPAVNSLFDDLRDGSVLLQAYDKVIPGSVNWRHVNKPPASGGELMRFKAVENTNYSIELGKHNGFSLVGVQGADITDGQRTLTLGLVWQLMRRDITNTLSALAQRLGKREITDTEMIRWANDMSSSGGKSSTIRSFKDKSIGSGIFLLDVLNGMKSSYVDYDLVTPGRTDEEAYANAKLSISIARKMGATIWLVPEDICQVRSRLVTTFIGKLTLSSVWRKFKSLTDDRFSYGYPREDVRNTTAHFGQSQFLWHCIPFTLFPQIHVNMSLLKANLTKCGSQLKFYCYHARYFPLRLIKGTDQTMQLPTKKSDCLAKRIVSLVISAQTANSCSTPPNKLIWYGWPVLARISSDSWHFGARKIEKIFSPGAITGSRLSAVPGRPLNLLMMLYLDMNELI